MLDHGAEVIDEHFYTAQFFKKPTKHICVDIILLQRKVERNLRREFFFFLVLVFIGVQRFTVLNEHSTDFID